MITSGSNLAHLFDYAVASSDATRAGTKLASTTFAFPDHTKQDSTTWFQANSSAATGFPNTTAPAPINGFGVHRPVAQAGSTEANLLALLSTTTLDTTAGFVNIVQVRLKDSGPGLGNGALASPFWSADILFNQANNTWTQVYPAPATGPATTTTTLAVSPPSPQPSGTNVTLTASVGAPSGTVAGSVQFKDGNTNIGSPVNVTSGQAQTATTALSAGSHTLTAAFTPTDTNAFTASTSSATPYTITSPATNTTTTLAITPASPITAGTQSTLTATVGASSGTPTGTVQFKDGASNIGSPVTVSGGHAQTTTTFAANTHSVTAQFIPDDTTAFNGSTSDPTSYVVNAASATTTHVTAFDVSPASPQPFGTTLTYTATVTPSGAVGHVNFLDGSTVITNAAVSGGTATTTSAALTGGSHTLSAQFVPDDPNAFTTSQSDTKSYTISAASTTTALDVAPTGPVTHGSTVTLTAHVTPSGAAGSVQFLDGATALGAPVSVTSGQASMQTTTLNAATHSLTATFTPSDGNYAPSTSSPASLQVTAAPSSTTLAVTPEVGTTLQGTPETLKATVTPSDAAGTVQFLDGDTPIGDPAPVTGGNAQLTQVLPVGTHSLTAHFISADSTTVTDSTSGVVSFVVKPPPTATTTALAVTPAGPVTFGTAVALTATVSPTAAGTVTFLDGTTTLGSKALSGGTATFATVGLGGGVHSLHARFVPASTDDFASSTGDASITVTAATTTTTLAVSPGGPVSQGKPVTLTATVTPPTAAGSVTFRNKTAVLGTVAVNQGKATLTTTSLAAGTASLTATFTAAHDGDFATSTSAPSTLAVVGPPTIGSVSANGEPMLTGTAVHVGEVVTVTASGFAPGETVLIAAHSTTVSLGSVRATSDGIVNVTFAVPMSLGAGSHTLTLTGKYGTATLHFTVAGSGVAGTGAGTGSGSASAGSGGGLASTGVRIAMMSGAALAMIIVGAWALAMAGPRRRHRGLHRFL